MDARYSRELGARRAVAEAYDSSDTHSAYIRRIRGVSCRDSGHAVKHYEAYRGLGVSLLAAKSFNSRSCLFFISLSTLLPHGYMSAQLLRGSFWRSSCLELRCVPLAPDACKQGPQASNRVSVPR